MSSSGGRPDEPDGPVRPVGSGSTDRPARTRWEVVVAAALALAGTSAVWHLAVPRHAICPAVYPAPAGCATADRVGAAFIATGGIGIALVVALVLLRTVALGRPGPSAAVLAVLGLLTLVLTNVVHLA